MVACLTGHYTGVKPPSSGKGAARKCFDVQGHPLAGVAPESDAPSSASPLAYSAAEAFCRYDSTLSPVRFVCCTVDQLKRLELAA